MILKSSGSAGLFLDSLQREMDTAFAMDSVL